MSWTKRAPKTRAARRRLLARCGPKCFLQPGAKSAPGFPVCSKATRDCQPDCDGLRAAYNRARQYKHRNVAARARAQAVKQRCSWAA